MFAPGADSLAKEFGVTNDTVIALTVTIAVLGFSMGPLVFAPASELFGRVPIYNVCGTIYVAFTIGLALSKNVAMFLVFRFICGCAASAFMTCGGGTIADLLPPQERGRAAAVFSAGPLLGPVSD
jgi:MFS family permease